MMKDKKDAAMDERDIMDIIASAGETVTWALLDGEDVDVCLFLHRSGSSRPGWADGEAVPLNAGLATAMMPADGNPVPETGLSRFVDGLGAAWSVDDVLEMVVDERLVGWRMVCRSDQKASMR